MLDGHDVTIEQRPARCCDEHSDSWVVCACGWEANTRGGDDANATIMAHRLIVIEAVLNAQPWK